jgi:hypothetical protein
MSTEFEVGKRVVIKGKHRATIVGIEGKKLIIVRDDQDESMSVSASACEKAKGRAPSGIAEKIAPFLKKMNKEVASTEKAGKLKPEKASKAKPKKAKAESEDEEAPVTKTKDEKIARKKAKKEAKSTKKDKKAKRSAAKDEPVNVAKKKFKKAKK